MLIHCVKLWMAEGLSVVGIVSNNPEVLAWATGEGVPVISMEAGYAEVVATMAIDYLFSVANLRMLPAKVVQAPRRAAINYHDALLPRYAGIHATTWAILHQETLHGITWHLMDLEADTGDVVKSRPVPITAQDTSASLNLKCFEAGVSAFAELIQDLMGEGLRRVPQDLGNRTYFGKYQRPVDAGLISWSEPAELLSARCRAYDFGQTPNSFGTLKFLAGDCFFIPRTLEVLPITSGLAPGTVVSLDGKGMQVATGTLDVLIASLQFVDGRPVPVAEFAAISGIRPGMELPEMAEEMKARHSNLWQSACRSDERWALELAIQHIPAPYHEAGAGLAISQDGIVQDMQLPDGLLGEASYGRASRGMLAFALCMAFLRRLSGAGELRIDFKTPECAAQVYGMEELFSPYRSLPLPDMDAAVDLHSYLQSVAVLHGQALRRGPIARDIYARYPSLAAWVPDPARGAAAVRVEFVASLHEALPPKASVLTIQIHQDSGAMRWCGSPTSIVEQDMKRLVAQYHAFQEGLAHEPGLDLRTASLLPEEERRHLLIEKKQTARAYPRDMAFHQIFSVRAGEQGERLAVKCGADTLTYAELDRRTSVLARYLRKLDVGRGDRVGVFLERSTEMIVALLAVMKSGAAYVPLDPIYPDRRLELMVGDSGMRCVLTVAALAPKLPAEGLHLVEMDAEWVQIEANDNALQSADAVVSPEDLAYVIYTSGSTGRPKGVQVPHRALTNFLWSMAKTPGMGPQDHLAALTTICFDIAGLELYLPLLAGAVVEIVPTAICRDGLLLKEFLEGSPANIVQATPATWQMLIGAEWAGSSKLKVLCGGEPLPSSLARDLLARCKELWNLFGPTETTIWSSCCRILDPGKITIGEPIANTQFYVLDAFQNPVPLGLPGELYIGGDGVAAGYLGRPDLTETKFVPDPFHGQEGAKMYRTGDMVRYLRDGGLQYMSRMDGQVKLRGYRVELGEIEALIGQDPDVSQALAILTDDGGSAKRILAYAVLRNEAAGIIPAILDRLKAQLPSYMVPAAIIPLKAFPLLPNGKVDRNSLPKSVETRPSLNGPSDNSYEAMIAQAWKSVLQSESIGLNEKFFDAGGDSISLTRLVVELGHRFGRRFSVTTLFEHPTIQSLADYMKASDAAASHERSPVNAKRNSLRQSMAASKIKRRT